MKLNCRRHGIVCKGRTRNDWWHRSQHLQACGLHRVSMTDADIAVWQQLPEMSLGASALILTKMQLTTNKNKGANRAISASFPNNVKFSRNAQGCMCSINDRMNYGPSVSMLQKSVQCPITRGGQVASAAKQMQNDVEYQRAYHWPASVNLSQATCSVHQVQEIVHTLSNYFAARRNSRHVDMYKKCPVDMTAAQGFMQDQIIASHMFWWTCGC